MNRVEKMISEKNKMIYDLLNENPEIIAQTEGRVKPTHPPVVVNCNFRYNGSYLSDEFPSHYPAKPKK